MTFAYDDELGWARLDDLVSPERARLIAEDCQRVLANPTAVLGADKPHGGTRRLVDVTLRVSATTEIAADLTLAATTIITEPHRLTEATFRCPGPGYGAQKLHTDTAPMMVPGPDRVATVIVALCDFTEHNGPTRLVPGSHRRPDLQRLAGELGHHPDEVLLTGPAGTGFVFSGHVLHSGTRNESDDQRPALQFVFRGESDTYLGGPADGMAP